jgi:hypothetical protein
MANTRNHGAN